MRKRIAVGAGLIAILLVTLAVWSMRPYEPVRIGMTQREVEAVLGYPVRKTFLTTNYVAAHPDDYEENFRNSEQYHVGPTWLGYSEDWVVVYEFPADPWHYPPEIQHVKKFDVYRTRPPLLDRALKAVGW